MQHRRETPPISYVAPLGTGLGMVASFLAFALHPDWLSLITAAILGVTTVCLLIMASARQ